MSATSKRKLTIAVVFGGRSVEHDVSVVTGNQIIRAFEGSDHDIIPLYITVTVAGTWVTPCQI
jgi:D-alanine-D-alanine ligase